MSARLLRSAGKSSKRPERRGAVRANRVVAIRHRLHKVSRRVSPAEWGLSTTRNMSVTGVLFLSDRPYKVGDMIELTVTMSGVIDIIKGFARVVRVAERGPHAFDVAVQMQEPKARTRSAKAHFKG